MSTPTAPPRDREPDLAWPPAPTALPSVAPAYASVPVPAPVSGPFTGLVCSILCTLGGGWLLLAPFAFDYRAGAAKLPRPAVVDLSTGAAVAVIGLLAALLFAASLAGRLRPAPSPAAALAEPEPEPAPESDPEPEPAPAPQTGFGAETDLRDLLVPLVAALTADLRSRQDPDQ